MRLFLLFLVFFSFILLDTLFSQDIEVTLSGSTSSQGFAVKNSSGNTLFRIRGDGTTGFGTATPTGMFDILGGSTSLGNGKSINILAQSTNDPLGNGGDISFTSGNALGSGDGKSGNIFFFTSGYDGLELVQESGDITLDVGTGDRSGGNINMTAGDNQGASGGKINIFGADYINNKMEGGKIEIISGTSVDDGPGGSVNIISGIGGNSGTGGPAGKISLTCGSSLYHDGADIELNAGYSSDANGGDIILSAGNNSFMGDGGNIILNPGSSGDGATGNVIVNGSGTYSGTWTLSSDVRFKKNIQHLENTIDKIEQLNGVSYELRREEFSKKNFSDGRQIGLIAQDVEKVYPELVVTDNEGYKSVAYQNIVAVLIEAVKEQQKSIDQLKKEVELLRSATGNNSVEVSSLGN